MKRVAKYNHTKDTNCLSLKVEDGAINYSYEVIIVGLSYQEMASMFGRMYDKGTL